MNRHTHKTALMGLILAFAMILSYIESLIPFFGGVPGMKLGLPNMAIVLVLFIFGSVEGIVINILRILLTGFLFGNLFGILFSIAGALISFAVMVIVKKTDKFDIRGVSVFGGISHNVGQLLIAAFVVRTSGIIYYFPFLLLAGTITGFLNGLLAEIMIKYFNKNIKQFLDSQNMRK